MTYLYNMYMYVPSYIPTVRSLHACLGVLSGTIKSTMTKTDS